MSSDSEKILADFDAEVEEIRDECVAEGYPSNGSNFELRYEQLYNNYRTLFPEVFA